MHFFCYFTIYVFLSSVIPLKNPVQSSNYQLYGCVNNKCTAEKAIDGDLGTRTTTKSEPLTWWSAELEEQVQIEKILLYLDNYTHSKKRYSKIKVEVRQSNNTGWKICKDTYSVEGNLAPHEVYCDVNVPPARVVGVVSEFGSDLVIREIYVFGTAGNAYSSTFNYTRVGVKRRSEK